MALAGLGKIKSHFDDGYPTEETLDKISNWPFDQDGWFEFIKQAWWMPDWGWHMDHTTNDLGYRVREYKISTGGWSGNESIIAAMKSNIPWWSDCWVQSRRGGHYIFEEKLETVHERTNSRII